MIAEKNVTAPAIERMLKQAMDGTYESTVGKFEAREMILKDPPKKSLI